MNRGTILFRVDGSTRSGMGRVARCLALANALQRRRYQMTFFGQLEGTAWPERIRRFRHAVSKAAHSAGSKADREAFCQEVTARGALVVITDSPTVDANYLGELGERAPVVISLDDRAEGTFPVDLLLNPNFGGVLDDYDLGVHTQFLAGKRYAMIRSEFRRARNIRATEPSGPTRVLVALGAGNQTDTSIAIAKALLAKKRIEKVELILGCEPTGRKLIEPLLAQHHGRLQVTVDSRDLGLKMTKSHLLVTAGGNTSLEGACVGMPMLLVARDVAQERNAAHLDEVGAAQYLGQIGKLDFAGLADVACGVLDDTFERKAMSRSGRLLIDGRGADRIVTATELLLHRATKIRRHLAAA